VGAALFPRIDEINTHWLKVGDVARDELQAMHQSRCGNQGVALKVMLRSTVGHMKLGTALGYDRVHGKDSTVKSGQDVRVNPGSQHEALLQVASRQQQGSGFDFQDRHGRQVKLQVINGPRPCSDTRIGTIGPPQFGQDVGIEQEHQVKSGTWNTPAPMRGGSNTMSSLPGMATASDSPSCHLAPASSRATEYSGSNAPGFQIQTRDHFRIDTVTEMAR
jgi:hypothetical protein